MVRRDQIYCCICGAPTIDPGYWGPDWPNKKWLTKIVFLTTAHITPAQTTELDEYFPPRPRWSAYAPTLAPPGSPQHCLRLNATHQDSGLFSLPSGETVAPLSLEWRPLAQQQHGSRLFLPVHFACVAVSDFFIQSVASAARPSHGSVTSARELWRILCQRMLGGNGDEELMLPEPHNYFGGAFCRSVCWEPGNDSEAAELLEQCPLDIDNVTQSVLANLKPQSKSLTPGTHDLGAELSPSTFPWLWDLDMNLIAEKRKSGDWDWGLLVSQLLQETMLDPGNSLLELPLQLRNRCRIWRILEEARFNDIANQVMTYRTQSKRAPFTTSGPRPPPAGRGHSPPHLQLPPLPIQTRQNPRHFEE